MNLFLRFFYLVLTLPFKSKVPKLGPCRTSFLCWPTDLDVLMHMNNGKYFSILDLARIDLMGRSGLLKIVKQQGWYPVVVAETARFKKSLELFDRFDVETKVIGWDEKAVLLGQNFYRGDTLICEAVIRARFLKKKGGSVLSAELLEAFGLDPQSPQLEPWIESWNSSQAKNNNGPNH